MQQIADISVEIPSSLGGLRFDQALTKLFPEYSRSRLQDWVKKGCVLLDGAQVLTKQRVIGGERVSLRTESPEPTESQAEDLPLDIVYSDPELLIVNKTAGLVVHPAAGHSEGTLLNALLYYAPELAALPRCGIVHRLDKDTSGLLMIARTLKAHKALVEQMQARSVRREYLALVQGELSGGGTANLPIGRHPVDRKRFAVREGGKRAITHYWIEERLSHHTVIRVKLETGRTHQIRVHMAHLHHPLVGDPSYGRLRFPVRASEQVVQALRAFRRQALHAEKLGLVHPTSGEYRKWSGELPTDFSQLLEALRGHP